MPEDVIIWAAALIVTPVIVGVIYAGAVELVQKIQE